MNPVAQIVATSLQEYLGAAFRSPLMGTALTQAVTNGLQIANQRALEAHKIFSNMDLTPIGNSFSEFSTLVHSTFDAAIDQALVERMILSAWNQAQNTSSPYKVYLHNAIDEFNKLFRMMFA